MYLQVETTFEHETPSAFLIKSSLIFPTFRRKNSKYVKIQKFNDYTFFSVEIFSLSWFLCTFDGVFRIRQRNKKSVEFFFLPLLIMNEVKPYASWAHKKLWFLIFMCKNEMRNHILVWKIIGTANWMRLLWKSLEFVSLSLRIRFLMSFQRNETAFFPHSTIRERCTLIWIDFCIAIRCLFIIQIQRYSSTVWMIFEPNWIAANDQEANQIG